MRAPRECLYDFIFWTFSQSNMGIPVHLYRRRRDSEKDLRRDAYQGQILPADLQDSKNQSGQQRSQVLISYFGTLFSEMAQRYHLERGACSVLVL